MVFEMDPSSAPDMSEPLSFRNDYMSLLQEVYRYDNAGKKTHVNAKLKQDLTSFAKSPPRRMETRGVPSTRQSLMEYFDLGPTPDSRCLSVRI